MKKFQDIVTSLDNGDYIQYEAFGHYCQIKKTNDGSVHCYEYHSRPIGTRNDPSATYNAHSQQWWSLEQVQKEYQVCENMRIAKTSQESMFL